MEVAMAIETAPEQSSGDSDAGIHERLVSAFTPEAAESETPETPADDDSALTDTAEAPGVPDTVDFIDDDGTAYKIPKALEDKIPLRADYTRKTAEAARLAEAAHDRLYFAEAQERFNEAVSQKGAEVQALKIQLKQLEAIDTGSLYASDPSAAWRIRDQRDLLMRQVAEGEQQLGSWKSQFGQIVQQHGEKQWSLAVDGARQRIGAFTPGEDVAMRKQMEALGFTERELKGRYADPRILHAIYKAAKWDTLQATKGKALETAKGAPPVLKPGASKGPGVAAEQQYRDARAKLAKSGDVRDAARLFLLKDRARG